MTAIFSFFFFVRVVAIAPFDLMPADLALEHGRAMVLAAGGGVSERDIDKVMRHESGGWIDARPGMKHWPHVAARFPKRRWYICGVLQATAHSAAECVAWQRDLVLAYRAGADYMRAWRGYCVKIGRHGKRVRRCAEAGYALGVAAARDA